MVTWELHHSMSDPDEDDILGIFSLIFWGLTLIGLVKYAFIVLHADDFGEGGTFAVYSLLCRHLNLGQISGSHQIDDCPSTYRPKGTVQRFARRLLEKNQSVQRILIIFVMIGTSMVIGDGVLNPAISVLSAIQGIQSRNPQMSTDIVVVISALILIILFLMQKHGTSKVGFVFSPIMVTWFLFTGIVGAYDICVYYPKVFKGLSPHYIFHFFAKNQRLGWTMFGAVFLSLTGLEAMFADLGHFNKKSIQLGFTVVVYPALVITYAGQAAYLIKHPEDISDAFYKSTPKALFWPMFMVSTLASIVTSQGMITAAFSIIRQSIALDCFPPVKIVHTSKLQEGQIYSPEVNYSLMVVCLTILLGFRSQEQIGNAYGVVVIWVMIMTTFLVALVMIVIWNTHILLVLAFLVVFGFIEGVFMVAAMDKVSKGGWVPFGIAALLLVIMLSWYYGRQKQHSYEIENRVSVDTLSTILSTTRIPRPQGICFFYTSHTHDLPPILLHYIKTVNSLHQVVIMVTIKLFPVKTIPLEERFVGGKIGPRGIYRCLVQYGYVDELCREGEEFVNGVIGSLKPHIPILGFQETMDNGKNSTSKEICIHDLEVIDRTENCKVVFVMGKPTLRTSKKSMWIDRMVIDNLYRFLERNSRSSLDSLNIPPSSFLQLGMFYEI
ncbi:hypothetical protein KI387_004834 [Taxus chinensis]|uniref:Potassium transporter n=1 Tax=Taxus chinensis TaxID=29808 RepID=A0AA38GL59_TAXCH|nr:hypothetical protein KI387_004834 [Taxus chinensis]